ncbi:MAG: hypothetical protein HDR20_08010 [Lachnospiraceae bacterium]|nr:hypothetical protein [Lachnospiraceae bacterium]
MGFFDKLDKFINGTSDLIAKVGEQTAKQINNMSDEELDKRHSVSADEMRMKAAMLQVQSEMLKMKKEEREMQMKKEEQEM